MKVFVKGQGEVNLTQQHFVATGGQASVYVRSGVAYKIYTDPKDVVPQDKFQALAAITDPNVIRPRFMLLDGKSKPVGYAMDAVADNVSLCQLFTKAFRDRNHLTNDHIIDVAAKLRGHVANVHAAGVVIVDLNELNILVPTTFDDTFLIDVDSYQTKGYPATVIMPSVRDWSSKQFTDLSDWFSFAVLAFQLFVGCHPYKGTHPPSANLPKDQQLEQRMRQNLSAFRPDVRLPKCCYSFDVIPQTFRDWLRAVLDDGKRVSPPDPKGGPIAAIVTPQRVLVSTGKLTITEFLGYDGWELSGYTESGARTLALVRQGQDLRVLLNGAAVQALRSKRDLYDVLVHGQTLLGFTPKRDQPFALNLHQGVVTFVDLERGTAEILSVYVKELARAGERFYVRSGTQVVELEFSELSNRVIVSASHVVANVVEMASRLYEGCATQNMLGAVYVSLFPRSKAGYQVRVKELDPYKIVDAKFEGGVLMVVGAKDGRYDRLVLRFDSEFDGYDLRTIPDVPLSGLNFVSLATGICVAVTEDERIEAFPARPGAGMRVVDDPAIGSDMRLVKVGGKAGFARGDRIYQIGLK